MAKLIWIRCLRCKSLSQANIRIIVDKEHTDKMQPNAVMNSSFLIKAFYKINSTDSVKEKPLPLIIDGEP